MDFTLSDRETYFRDRVKTFIDQNIRPRQDEYNHQAHEGERWKVIPVIEEVKEKAKAAGLVELLHAAAFGADPCRRQLRIRRHAAQQYRICVMCRGDGQDRLGERMLQLLGARYGQHGGVPPLRHARAEGPLAEAADGGRNPLRLPDDRARRGFLRRDQYPDLDAARWRRLRHQRTQMVVERGRRSALQGRGRDGQDQPGRLAPHAAKPDPGADGMHRA